MLTICRLPGAGKLAPDAFHCGRQHPVLEGSAVAESAGLAGENRHVMPRIVDRLATSERTMMLADDPSVLADHGQRIRLPSSCCRNAAPACALEKGEGPVVRVEDHINLIAIRHAAMVLAPGRLLRITKQIRPGDMVVMPLSARRMRLKNSSAQFVQAPSRL
jgi:hypothetical protein